MILMKFFAFGVGLVLLFWVVVGMSLVYLAATEAWPAVLAVIALMFYTRSRKEAGR
jgi:hypothetical protein